MSTRIAPLAIAPLVLALGLISGTAQAALQGRDLNGSLGSFEAYYDTYLDITWLADANYAATQYTTSNGTLGDADGMMNWENANTWAANLSLVDTVNNLTYDNWRLPFVVDTSTLDCDYGFSGTDCGYNVDTATGEMAHLFYVELGNKAYIDTSGNYPQPGWGLTNPGPFTNLQASDWSYWTATDAPDFGGYTNAWLFDFQYGYQNVSPRLNGNYALAVSTGDVGAVPEAESWAMLLAGLGLVGAATRRRRG